MGPLPADRRTGRGDRPGGAAVRALSCRRTARASACWCAAAIPIRQRWHHEQGTGERPRPAGRRRARRGDRDAEPPRSGQRLQRGPAGRADRRLAATGARSRGALPGAARRRAAFPGRRRHQLAGTRGELWAGAELRRVDGDHSGDAVAERVPQADHRRWCTARVSAAAPAWCAASMWRSPRRTRCSD